MESAFRRGPWAVVGRVVVVAGAAGAAAVSLLRRDPAHRATRVDAQRMRLALAAGNMGTWHWDVVADRVEWDVQLEALFGLEPHTFDGSYSTYMSLIHPNDRGAAQAAVKLGMDTDSPWQFDHRVVWRDGTVHWVEGRGEPVHADDGTIIAATGVTIDIDERRALLDAERASRAHLRALLESSERLGELDDPDEVVATIATLAATHIGTWATVVRVNPDGALERTVAVHRDPSLGPAVREVLDAFGDDLSSVRKVLQTGAPLVFNDLAAHLSAFEDTEPEVADKARRIGYASCILVPITIAGRRLAVLTIGDATRSTLGPMDIELAVDLGRRGASALERARLWRAQQDRLEAEHHIVEFLQETIVPEKLPELPGIEICAAYSPAEVDLDVGGDWYDAFETPDGAIVVAVGDVAGHGIEAASLMGRVRNALRAYAIEDSDPASILLRLHRLLRAQDDDAMVTAFVSRHDPVTHDMLWSRAGHPPPLLVNPDGTFRFLDDVNGAPLGTMAREYRSGKTRLGPGSLLVGYTDGLVERRDRLLDDGLAWLAETVCRNNGGPIDVLCDKLVADPFVPHPCPDDVCVIALRIDP